VRVALSLLTFDPRIAGGSERYVRGLCSGLERVGAHDYQALVPRNAPEVAGALPTVVATGVPASHGPAQRLRTLARLRLRPGNLREPLDAADVVHYPVTVPVPGSRRKTVVTLHDLQHRDRPELISGSKRLFRRFAYDRAAQTADQVIVGSNWVRARAIAELGLEPTRVHVAYHGVGSEWFATDEQGPREPFLLYPARAWPHKNHARLFEAYALLRAENPDLRLVLTGGGHAWPALPSGVESRGIISDVDLRDLYRRAAALVFPSLYEGFGLPVLEAMAGGCPVAASSAGSLPEVCSDAAVLFDPTSPEAIASGVREALARSTELSLLGPPRARGFTWEATARAHDDVYALCVT
jgi:glycosyltransferase involved in cell wall biosynthesis